MQDGVAIAQRNPRRNGGKADKDRRERELKRAYEEWRRRILLITQSRAVLKQTGPLEGGGIEEPARVARI